MKIIPAALTIAVRCDRKEFVRRLSSCNDEVFVFLVSILRRGMNLHESTDQNTGNYRDLSSERWSHAQKLCEMNQDGSEAGEQTQIQWITNNLARRYTKHRPFCVKSGGEEENVVRGIAIVLAITAALAVSGIAAPAPAQAGRLASTPYGCDPIDGPYPGYAPPYAYSAYYYGYPKDCGASIYFYFGPAYDGYRYGRPLRPRKRTNK